MLIIFIYLFIFISGGSSKYPDCDFTQNVAANQTYYVYTPNYPKNTSKAHCRWVATCPEGHRCQLICSEVVLVQSAGCVTDRLLVSRSGDPNFNRAEQYCGQGSLTATSYGRNISIGLITSNKARLRCTLNAVLTVKDNCECGCKKLLKSRIVGGEETEGYEYPSMVGVVDLGIEQIKFGGVIIDSRHVLTCAHCVVQRREEDVVVVPGGVSADNAISFESLGYRAKKFIIHPQFTTLNYDYDIALIKTALEIEFGEHVGPVCLPFKFAHADFTGKDLIVLGWGTVFPGGPTSKVLMETSVSVISQEKCKAVTDHLTNRQICTYTPGKDACQDDSGGPLLYEDPESGLLFTLAITSHGHACASGRPAINTRVPRLLDWIVTSTRLEYCRI